VSRLGESSPFPRLDRLRTRSYARPMDASTPTPPDERDPTAYEAPAVTDYGDLTEITAGMMTGSFLDKSFPNNTPKQDLTFSS
jgi:hypothetical protein